MITHGYNDVDIIDAGDNFSMSVTEWMISLGFLCPTLSTV